MGYWSMVWRSSFAWGLALAFVTCEAQASLPSFVRGESREEVKRMTDKQLLAEVQERAFRFFWEKSDPNTGLTNDRARNHGEDDYTVASVASTGYALAALPIAVSHKWMKREEAYQRALTTLRFLSEKMPNVHGWFYHFIDKRTGERVWNCELSTIDTALLMEGTLLCGQFWKGTEVEKLSNALYDRLDWQWVLTNDGTQPHKRLIAMGWTPEKGFIPNNWDHYCELTLLYLLGLGAKQNPLPAESWDAWERKVISYGGHETLAGEAIFIHQMAQAFYNFHEQRDRLGWDYWVSSLGATHINRQFCMDNASKRKTYAPDIWGLNANDFPDGYKAFAAPGEEDGTVSPTGAIASLLFTPKLSLAAGQAIYTRYGDKLWGRYGFGNAFNVDKDWYGPDVIGIDLGMVLLAIEDYRTGLPWKLLASHPSTRRAWQRAGFHRTEEAEPRPLQLSTETN